MHNFVKESILEELEARLKNLSSWDFYDAISTLTLSNNTDTQSDINDLIATITTYYYTVSFPLCSNAC